MRRLSTVNALALLLAYAGIDRDAADGCLGLLLDLCFGFSRAVPVAKQEASLLYLHLEIIPGINLDYMLVPERQSFGVNILFYLVHSSVNIKANIP